eukprot:COSAG02_NODE_43417_length_375_cov_0.594203_1_plen_114_part_10
MHANVTAPRVLLGLRSLTTRPALALLLVCHQPAAARACVRRRGMAGQGRGGLVLVYLRFRGALQFKTESVSILKHRTLSKRTTDPVENLRPNSIRHSHIPVTEQASQQAVNRVK